MADTALIWDLDGTLLDSYGVIVPSLQQTLAELQIDMNREDILRQATEDSVSALIKKAAAETGLPFQKIKERYSEISGGRYLEITAILHAEDALRETAALGVTHFVYTHRGRTAEPVLKNLGLWSYFREVVTSLNGFARKPSPDALLYLMKKHCLEKDRVFYVGDRSLDVDCAKNAGVRSILYSPSGAGRADYVVRDLLEVRGIAVK